MASQKVLGLKKLKTMGIGSVLNVDRVVKTEGEIDSYLAHLDSSWKKFARPCPIRPRHGFVDSRVVTNRGELVQVLNETLAADPEGEVMLVEFLENTTHNMVWTPSSLTVGEGIDGATAGKNVVVFPLSGQCTLSDLDDAGIEEGQDPYIEVVQSTIKHGYPILTQLRAGPKGDAKLDYIPTSVLVNEVLEPEEEMSLLEWENLILSKKDTPGVVVNRMGGSTTDHYSVHAKSFGIPVVTTRKVEVGEILTPVPFTPPHPMSVLRGVVGGDLFQLHVYTYEAALYEVLLSLHHMGSMEGSQGFWLGAAASFMVRLGSMAMKGECRHLRRSNQDRGAVYHAMKNDSISSHRRNVPRWVNILRYGDFGGGGVGGRAWAECGGTVATLLDAIRSLAVSPSDETVGSLTRALNTAVNQAHNNGWWLNKFGNEGLFSAIQGGAPNHAIKYGAFLYEVGRFGREMKDETVESQAQIYRNWTPISLKHHPIVGVQMGVIPGLPGISLKIRDNLLRSKHRMVVIPAKKMIDTLSQIAGGGVFVVPTDDGLSVEFRSKKKNDLPVVLWKERGVRNGAQK